MQCIGFGGMSDSVLEAHEMQDHSRQSWAAVSESLWYLGTRFARAAHLKRMDAGKGQAERTQTQQALYSGLHSASVWKFASKLVGCRNRPAGGWRNNRHNSMSMTPESEIEARGVQEEARQRTERKRVQYFGAGSAIAWTAMCKLLECRSRPGKGQRDRQKQ